LIKNQLCPLLPRPFPNRPSLWSSETRKLGLRTLLQPLQYESQTGQLILQIHPRLVIRPRVQDLIYIRLEHRRLVRSIGAQGLRDVLDVQRRLHEVGERVLGPLLEGRGERVEDLLQEVLQDVRRERARRRRHLRVHDHHVDQHAGRERRRVPGLARARGSPLGAGEAGLDGVVEAVGDGLGVDLEEARVNLLQDVLDRFGLVGELDGEVCFEERDQLGNDLSAEVGKVRDGEEKADALDYYY